MIDGLLQDLAVKAKARTGASQELVLWAVAMATLSVLSVVFLSAAAYFWLAGLYGGAVAALTVGCFHAAVAGAASIRFVVVRRRNKILALAEAKAAAKQPAWWTEPSVLAVGLEIARVIGWRKLAPLVTAGILAATLSSKRGERKSGVGANGAH